jgi:uncharacterized protein YegP (UPF0339 family)
MQSKHLVIEILQNEAGEWFWHAKAANGRLISTSGESFASKSGAREAAEHMQAAIPAAHIVDDTAEAGRRMVNALLDAANRARTNR